MTCLHGGDVYGASQAYGHAPEHWLDLSTGINPLPWPVPPVPQHAFAQLPYESPAFLSAAATYYGRDQLLAVAGSQAAIQLLPSILPRLPVLLPSLGYQEHRQSWAAAGATLACYPSLDGHEAARAIDEALARDSAQHLLVINPNNPTGVQFTPECLLAWASRLSDGACLMVDEAFIDPEPEQSLLSCVGSDWPNNLLVLRSFGKFFGLAGLRLGFVFAGEHYRHSLRQQLGPWAINGPAQQVASAAFADSAWQAHQRQQLPVLAAQCRALFAPLLEFDGVERQASRPLFTSYRVPTQLALALQDFCARHAILIRVIEYSTGQSLLRVGLLTDCSQQQARLRATLAAFIDSRQPDQK